jgi:virginiamycin B lyase
MRVVAKDTAQFQYYQDGNLWYTLMSCGLKFPVPTSDAGPWAITVDSHGVVWFLEESANQLGSYDPQSGAFHEYRIPTPQSNPQAVTTDESGNVWFTELTSNKLAEFVPGSPGIVEHSIPSLPLSLGSATEQLDCGPGALTWDPTGALWIACLFSNQIDEYFPQNGAFETFNLPFFPSGPAGLLLDGKGNLWFTAADANMLGKAVVSQLRNGTSEGIDEFAPLNQTYIFSFNEETSFLGGSTIVRTSLPTPSGIALDPAGRLWVTEHVDSSFDSYNPVTGSLDRYWTSQTHGAYGFSVSFPNGIAVGKDGTVWVAEHYGNKVAEFDPASGALLEYSASCCSSSYGGLYNLALAPDGTPWFVEVQGNAIGELVPSTNSSAITVTMPTAATINGAGNTIVLPLTFAGSASPMNLSLGVSGVSGTGALSNLTARFSNSSVTVSAASRADSDLALSSANLKPGIYDLTITASDSDRSISYSVILRLTVTGGGTYPYLLLGAVGGAVIVAVAVTAYLSASRPKRHRR